jgi:hypothetical protein
MRGSSARAPPIGVEVAGSVPARAVALVAQWDGYPNARWSRAPVVRPEVGGSIPSRCLCRMSITIVR